MIRNQGTSGREVNKFNLTFSGEIIAGHDPAEVKLRFGKLYSIDDPVRLNRFFSGETVILRRNLERKEAARCYHELHLLGAIAALVKVTTSDKVNELVDAQATTPPQTQDQTQAKAKRTVAASKPAAARSVNGKSPPNRAGKSARTPSIRHTAAIQRTARPVSPNAVARTPDKESRDSVDIAAAIKARKLASQRAAAEQAAQQKAALEEQQRRAQQEEARLAAEAAAQRAAQEAEEQRRLAEEEARQAAELAAARQREAEEAARKAAEEAAIKQRKDEEAARKAAEETAAKQRKAEEEAQKKAAKAEARRKAAEQEAQRRAQRQREKAERARQKAEAEARRKAELEALRRQAEEDARRKAEQAELEQKAREAAAQAERIKHEAQQRQAEAQRESANRRRAAAQALAEQQAQRSTQNDNSDTVTDAATAAAPRPVKARVHTPSKVAKATNQHAETTEIHPRKRQPGEPNLYQLRPFRANEAVRSRAQRALRHRRGSYIVGVVALAVLVLALANYLQRTVEPVIDGARAVAVAAHEGPVLLAGETLLFHDRAGNSTTATTLGELKLAALEPPLAFDGDGVMYARGRLASTVPNDSSLQLLRCDPPLTACRELSAELRNRNIDTFVLNPVDGSLLLVDVQAGRLLKADRDGKILATATIALPPQPVLQLHGGLLLINSATGPALSVLRYEDKAFGQQLDEILLLPPAIADADQLRVGNFLWSGDAWWIVLRNRESGGERLYRFDDAWNYISEVALPPTTSALQLTAWGTKTLVSDAQHLAMERFNAEGAAEANFVSATLDKMKTAQQRHLGLSNTAWHSGLLLCAILAVLGLGLGYLNTLRGLVYNARRESGAEPIDGFANSLQWINPAAHRATTLRRRTIRYCLFALGALVLATALQVTQTQMAALLIALSGPLLALLWLARQSAGHLGLLDERLVLVDHYGMYHIAGGSRIQHCGPFLCIDDVLVFSGTRTLPAFSPAQVQQQVKPLAQSGVKVDYRTVLVKLLQSRHPLAVGALAILGAVTAAGFLLSLQGIF
jgi:hypothetical protein